MIKVEGEIKKNEYVFHSFLFFISISREKGDKRFFSENFLNIFALTLFSGNVV